MESLASVFKSLSENFLHYAVYNSDDGNLFIVASDSPINKELDNNVLNNKKSTSILNRVGLRSIDDFNLRFLGNKKVLTPLFQTYKTEKTTDFFPRLSYIAAKSLFLQESAQEISNLHYYPLPIINRLTNRAMLHQPKITSDIYFTKSRNTHSAIQLYFDFINNKPFTSSTYSKKFSAELTSFKDNLYSCKELRLNEESIIATSLTLLSHTYPYIGKNKSLQIFDNIKASPCYSLMSTKTNTWLSLHIANISSDSEKAYQLTQTLLRNHSHSLPKNQHEYLIASGLLASIELKRRDLADKFKRDFLKNDSNISLNSLAIKLLIAQTNTL